MTRMEPRLRRRLAAILAADVVGYSRLMMADEPGTFRRVQALLDEVLRPGIESRGGRVFKMMGDGILAEFPSVVDAVGAAVALQDRLAARAAGAAPGERLLVRIGINLGDVIDHERDLYGQGVNLAARVEALAPPGGICVTRPVRDEIRDKLALALEDCGEIAVKNIARPVRVFRIRPGASAADAPGAPPPVARRARPGGRHLRPLAALLALAAALLVADVPPRDRPGPEPARTAEAETPAARPAGPPPERPAAFRVAEIDGTVFATTPSNLRAGPGTEFDIVGGARTGQPLALTGEAVVGGERWYRVRGARAAEGAFIHSGLVADAPPAAPGPEPARPREPAAAAEPAPPRDPPPAPAPIGVRITLDFSSHWSSCLPVGGAEVHRLELAPDSRWRRVHLVGAGGLHLRARARPAADGTGAVVQLLPFAHLWPEEEAIGVPLASTAPGSRGRAFSRRSAIEPLVGCGRIAAFVDVAG